MHEFDQAIALREVAARTYQGQTQQSYWNKVGPFGGITAATALNAVMIQPDLIGPPLALTVNYCGPLHEGTFDCTVHNVRTNRSTQHWQVSFTQIADAASPVVVLTASVVTGLRRDLWGLPAPNPPVQSTPEDAFKRDGRKVLNWFDRYDQHFKQNPMKEDDPASDLIARVRDNPERPLDFQSLAAICDTLFPAILAHRQQFIPIATVTMTTYFHVGPEALARHGAGYLTTVSRSKIHHQGFCDASGEVWADQTLFATTGQVMWYQR